MNIKDVIIRISEIPTKDTIKEWETKLSHIGNLENLTTENKTNLVDAINEVQEMSGGVSNASEVTYDDSTSQLGATNAQDAIIALYNKYKAVEVLANKLNQDVNGQTNILNEINTESENVIGITTNIKEKVVIQKVEEASLQNINSKARTTNAIDISYSDEVTNIGATNLQKAIEILANKFAELENNIKNVNNTVSNGIAELNAINTEVENEIGINNSL